jgi:hypothetical protein
VPPSSGSKSKLGKQAESRGLLLACFFAYLSAQLTLQTIKMETGHSSEMLKNFY